MTLASLMISISGMTLKPQYSDGGLGGIRRSYARMGKAEKVLGFKPRVNIGRWSMALFNFSCKVE